MLKKHMVPMGRHGQVVKHRGKGSQQAAMPDRDQINGLARGPMNSINDYAKATPMPTPVPTDTSDAGTDLGM